MLKLHLTVISADVAPGRHAVLLLDQAGWHLSHKLAVPHNITIVPLPTKCPELNPQENIWQFMRDNWLSNRVFEDADALIDHCCNAWNKLEAQPWTIIHRHARLGPSVLISESWYKGLWEQVLSVEVTQGCHYAAIARWNPRSRVRAP
jgi:transposase